MRIALLFSVFAALSNHVIGQTASPVRDPWKGFGLGSSVQMHKYVEVDGKTTVDERTTCKVESIHADGSAGIWTQAIENGKERINTSYHVHGGDPDKLGLKLESRKEATLTVDGKELPVTISRWISDKEKKDLEKIAKSFPEILKQGGLMGVQNVDVSVTFYEAKSPGIDIPYHEIETPGIDLSVGPRVIKAKYRHTRLGDDGKPVAETRFSETMARLNTEIEIKGKKANCVVFDVVSSQWEKDPNAVMVAKGRVWYSNDVPGREVKKELAGDSAKGKFRTTTTVVDYEIQPDVGKLDLTMLVADKNRPRIPGSEWNEMRLGAWVASVHEITNRGAKTPRNFDVVLTRVVKIHENNTFVTVSERLAKDGWQMDCHRLVTPLRPAAEPQGTGVRDEISVLGEQVACEKRIAELKSDWLKRTTTQWSPVDEKWKKLLAGTGLSIVKETESEVSKDSFSEYKTRSEGIIAMTGVEAFVAGNRAVCVVFKKQTWEGEKPWLADYSFHSSAVPGGQVASIHVGNHDYSLYHVLDFGEAEKTAPSIEQLRDFYRQAAQLLKTVNLEKLDER